MPGNVCMNRWALYTTLRLLISVFTIKMNYVSTLEVFSKRMFYPVVLSNPKQYTCTINCSFFPHIQFEFTNLERKLRIQA